MVPLLGLVIGFAFGWMRAKKRGGNRLDCLQYGAGHGIAFFVLFFALAIIADRTGLV